MSNNLVVPDGQQFKYWAFISYSHADSKWGEWLMRALEHYAIPKALVGNRTDAGVVPKSLKPIFRDRDEIAASTDISPQIREGLAQSRNLIVVCSPSAVASQWVNQEILFFKFQHGGGRIFCFIVDGEPNAIEKGMPVLLECLPEPTRYQVDEKGLQTTTRILPIAGDARSIGDGRDRAFVRVIAGALGVGFDVLWHRERRDRFKRLVLASVGGIAVAASVAGTWLYGKIHSLEVAKSISDHEHVVRDFVSANKLLSLDKSRDALVYLARSLEKEPQFAPAAQRVFAVLTQRNFALPLASPMCHDKQPPPSADPTGAPMIQLTTRSCRQSSAVMERPSFRPPGIQRLASGPPQMVKQ